jgi:hypothetical protein
VLTWGLINPCYHLAMMTISPNPVHPITKAGNKVSNEHEHGKQVRLKVILDKLADENHKADSRLNSIIEDAQREHAHSRRGALVDFHRAIDKHGLHEVYQEYLDKKAKTE